MNLIRDTATGKQPMSVHSAPDAGRPPAEGGTAVPPPLGLPGMLRWSWTQLTSMRTALFLLLLLAVAAVPGSLFPQLALRTLPS